MQTKGDYMGHYAENGIIENPIGTLNKKDYKLKRPEKGYNTPAEREWSAWSDVSDWELFFKGTLIGHVYYVGTLATQWAGYLEEDYLSRKVQWSTRKEVVDDLCLIHHKFINSV